MSRPRTCPNCGVVIGVETGYYFDKEFSMICAACDKPVLPTSWATENKMTLRIKPVYPTYPPAYVPEEKKSPLPQIPSQVSKVHPYQSGRSSQFHPPYQNPDPYVD